MASRSSRSTGTLAWAAKTRSVRAVGADRTGPSRNGNRASPKSSRAPSSWASAPNSAISRWLCSTNRSQPDRKRTAARVAGTLIPGSPVSSTGRPGLRRTGSAVSSATTGPVAASSSTSGVISRIRRRTPARVSTSTGSAVAAMIWLGDGITGFSITSWVRDHSAGIAAKVAALHLR